MRISVWQQFSSNHSSNFTLVGEFATNADAVHAASEIRSIIQKITEWHSLHPDTNDMYGYGDPTPIEHQLAEQYKLDWPHAIDWYYDVEVEVVLDHLVFIDSSVSVNILGEPFEQFLTQLGSSVFARITRNDTEITEIVFDLSCKALDEAAAEAIQREYIGYLSRIEREGSVLQFPRWTMRLCELNGDVDGFFGLTNMLKERGCSEFTYRLRQVNSSELETLEPMYTLKDIDLLISLLNNGPKQQWFTLLVDALARFKDKRAIEPLKTLLELTKLSEYETKRVLVALDKLSNVSDNSDS